MDTKTTGTHGLSRIEFIGIIGALMALNALAIDIMLPALPNMGEALGVSFENDRQLVLSMYMLGFGAAQIFVGPISDRLGRRAPLLIGLLIYIAAAFAAVFATDFNTLLILRVVQGIGAAGTRVIVAAIVRDCFAGRAMAEIMSLVFMVFMTIPVIAPGIGQLLLLSGPWWTIFIFMAGLAAIITLWTFFRLPETLDESNRRPLTATSIIEGFVTVFSNRIAISYTMAGTFIFGALIGFIYTAQQIYVGIYDLGPRFPLAFAIVAGFMALSSYLNSRVVGIYGMRRISHFAVLIFICVGTIWWIASLFGPMPFWMFYILLSIEMFMFGWVVSNMNSLSMEPLGRVAGTASSVFGFIQTVGGTLLGLVIGQMFDGTLVPTAAGFMVMGICALGFVLYAEKGKLFVDGSSDQN